ncbi:MAG: NlpC/P60 family protein [Eubacteriaceae bacterium]|nr:NlpC/P60 family protein [Eubacteriaceae bacterium]
MKKKLIMAVCGVSISVLTAFTATGESFAFDRVQNWDVKANGRTVATVQTEAEGWQVLNELKADYYNTGEEQVKAETDQLVTVEATDKDVMTQTVDQSVDNIEKTESITFTDKEIKEGEEAIPYGTSVETTDEMYRGETKVIQKGVDGSKHVIKEVTETNGKTAEEKIISSDVTTAPTEKIVLKGTKDPLEKTRQEIVEYAEKFIGTEYVWGGESLTDGIDCSGFTMQVFSEFGYSLPHYSQAQADCGSKVDSLEEAKAGDIIIYEGHVAIYRGDGTIIHATPPQVTSGTPADYSEILAIRRIAE